MAVCHNIYSPTALLVLDITLEHRFVSVGRMMFAVVIAVYLADFCRRLRLPVFGIVFRLERGGGVLAILVGGPAAIAQKRFGRVDFIFRVDDAVDGRPIVFGTICRLAVLRPIRRSTQQTCGSRDRSNVSSDWIETSVIPPEPRSG